MKRVDFSQKVSMEMKLANATKDMFFYEQYKKERPNYQQIEIVQQIVDQQIKRFPHQENFRQQARQFYDYISKVTPSQISSIQSSENLAKSMGVDDQISFLFANKQEENQRQSITPQHQNLKTVVNQQNYQKDKHFFASFHVQQMKKRAGHLFQDLQDQKNSIQYKDFLHYLQSRNLTVGILRKMLRSCIKTSLVFTHYSDQINQQCNHEDDCFLRTSILSKIDEMETQGIKKFYPEGKQSLLRQFFGENYDILTKKSTNRIKKSKEAKKES